MNEQQMLQGFPQLRHLGACKGELPVSSREHIYLSEVIYLNEETHGITAASDISGWVSRSSSSSAGATWVKRSKWTLFIRKIWWNYNITVSMRNKEFNWVLTTARLLPDLARMHVKTHSFKRADFKVSVSELGRFCWSFICRTSFITTKNMI